MSATDFASKYFATAGCGARKMNKSRAQPENQNAAAPSEPDFVYKRLVRLI